MYYDSNGNPRAVEQSAASLTECLTRVYWWMTLALGVSAFSAWIVGTSEGLTKIFIRNPGIFFGLAIVEILLVIGIGAGIRKLTAATATALFILYAAVNGITLSVVVIAYQLASVAQVFGITAATFAGMALVGTTTKRDLSGLGSFFFMALIGLIIASVINLFWANDTLYWICSYAGVLIFVGLTAYDANKIKRMFLAIGTEDQEAVGKIAILGALTLYLDFVNLFLYLLRIFGRRR